MTQLDILRPEHEPLTVAAGDIFALGRHRLMCGDATDKAQVAKLFAGQRPTLVVTSPPYAKQRDYDRPIPCWDSMMLGALDGHDFADDVQMLINLGVIHRNEELMRYWNTWIDMMRQKGNRLYAQYVWDKGNALPGSFKGRLSPAHEFVFHLNKQSIKLNKWLPTKPGRKAPFGYNVRAKDGKPEPYKSRYLQPVKAPDSVIRINAVRFGEATGHPAQMPVALASFIIKTWAKDGCVVQDPFLGSGTTLLACEAENVAGLGMEISPAYCTIAINRWNKAHPDQHARRISMPGSWPV